MKFKLVDITQMKTIPPPRVLTPEDEAEIIARCKAEIEANPASAEAECRQLLEQYERGELVDAEALLKQIEAGTPPRKPT